jgi:hypothetical protein
MDRRNNRNCCRRRRVAALVDGVKGGTRQSLFRINSTGERGGEHLKKSLCAAELPPEKFSGVPAHRSSILK